MLAINARDVPFARPAMMRQICAGIAATHGATIDLGYMQHYPGVINSSPPA
jgi:amidohydrolase/hippurate hydrolase